MIPWSRIGLYKYIQKETLKYDTYKSRDTNTLKVLYIPGNILPKSSKENPWYMMMQPAKSRVRVGTAPGIRYLRNPTIHVGRHDRRLDGVRWEEGVGEGARRPSWPVAWLPCQGRRARGRSVKPVTPSPLRPRPPRQHDPLIMEAAHLLNTRPVNVLPGYWPPNVLNVCVDGYPGVKGLSKILCEWLGYRAVDGMSSMEREYIGNTDDRSPVGLWRGYLLYSP